MNILNNILEEDNESLLLNKIKQLESENGRLNAENELLRNELERAKELLEPQFPPFTVGESTSII